MTVMATVAMATREAVEEVVAEAVLGPCLHVVLHRRVGRDEHRRPEEAAVRLEREREHIEKGTEGDQCQEHCDDKAGPAPLADAEEPGARFPPWVFDDRFWSRPRVPCSLPSRRLAVGECGFRPR